MQRAREGCCSPSTWPARESVRGSVPSWARSSRCSYSGSSSASSWGSALSLSASAGSEMTLIRYLDVVLLVLAAPIMLLIGVPAVGYLVGAAAWIALRAVGEGVDRAAAASTDAG